MKRIIFSLLLLILILLIFLPGCKKGYVLEISNQSGSEITDCTVIYGCPDEHEFKVPVLTATPVAVKVSTKANAAHIITYSFEGKKYRLKWGCFTPDDRGKTIVSIYGDSARLARVFPGFSIAGGGGIKKAEEITARTAR